MRREQLHHRLTQAMRHYCSRAQLRLQSVRQQLQAMSPLRTLDRGYAIVTRRADGSLVRSHQDVVAGDEVDARLARAMLLCTVTGVEENRGP